MSYVAQYTGHGGFLDFRTINKVDFDMHPEQYGLICLAVDMNTRSSSSSSSSNATTYIPKALLVNGSESPEPFRTCDECVVMMCSSE